MTSVEIMSPTLGDAFINLQEKSGVGFNACSLRNVAVAGHSISFDLDTFPSSRSIRVRFSGVDRQAKYQVTWNGSHSSVVDGHTLARDGYLVQQ